MELILRQQLEDRVLEDVARDVVFVAGIDRDAGETPALLGLEVLDGEVLAGRLHHDGGSHDLAGFDARQGDATLDQFALRLAKDALRSAHIDHGRHLLAAHGGLVAPGGEDLGDQFREQHQGIGDEDEHADDPGGRHGQGSPIGGADGLGDNLREHEDQESEDGRYQPEILLAEDLDGLRSHAGRTDGVGDGVEREDGAHGAIDVVFVLLHQRGGLAALVLPHRDVGHRRGEEHRFEDGAKKGK